MFKRGESIFLVFKKAVFPRYCVVCGDEGSLLCEPCKMRWTDVPIEISGHRHVFSFAYADPVVRGLLCAWKYAYDWSAWDTLREKLETVVPVIESYIQATKIDTITYVPLHPVKACQRGFDQAQVIAQWIGDQTGVPVKPLLARTIYTKQQAQQTMQKRQEMLAKNPFILCDDRAKRVLLVDDVWTTGSTMQAAVHCLKKGNIDVWKYTLAKGLMRWAIHR